MRYVVPLIPQTHKMSCWAASIAMIVSWKKRTFISEEKIILNPNGWREYKYDAKDGLSPDDEHILRINGFEIEAPQNYTVAGITSLLARKGPLWVATLCPFPHARVLTGIEGSVLYINDPAPTGFGSIYPQSFGQFFSELENWGAATMALKSPLCVAYMH